MFRFRKVSGVALILLIGATAIQASDSFYLNYQGLLTTPGGSPVANGQYHVTFTLWDDLDLGNQLWLELDTLDVSDGRFNVTLGRNTPLTPSLLCYSGSGSYVFQSCQQFLQIQIEGDPAMTPRSQLVSVPFAGVARKMSGDIFTDAGVIQVGAGDTHTRVDTEGVSIVIAGDTLGVLRLGGQELGLELRSAAQGGIQEFLAGPSGALIRSQETGDTLCKLDANGLALGGDIVFHEYGHGLTWRLQSTGDTLLELGGQEVGDAFIKISDPSTGATATYAWDGTSMATPHVSGGITAAYASSEGTIFVDEFTGDTLAGYGNIGGFIKDSVTGGGIIWGTQLDVPAKSTNAITHYGAVAFPVDGAGTIGGAIGVQDQGEGFVSLSSPAGHQWLASAAGQLWTDGQTGDTIAMVGNQQMMLKDSATGAAMYIGTNSGAQYDYDVYTMMMTSTHDTILELGGQEIGDAFIKISSTVYEDALQANANKVLCSSTQTGDTLFSLSGDGFSFGSLSRAEGAQSFAGGTRAEANHAGSVVLADGAPNDLVTTAADQVRMRASGGYILYSNGPKTAGVELNSGASQWAMVSDSSAKTNIRPIDGDDVLNKLAALPVTRWSYKAEDDGVDHIGPMAQDFYNAFGLGHDETKISSLDPSGVALAAIKALYEQNQELKDEIAGLRETVEELKNRQ